MADYLEGELEIHRWRNVLPHQIGKSMIVFATTFLLLNCDRPTIIRTECVYALLTSSLAALALSIWLAASTDEGTIAAAAAIAE